TGTLTEGKPEVTDVIQLANMSVDDIIGISAAIESFSQHPLASAITRKADKSHVRNYQANNFQSMTGKGIRATIDQVEYFVGSPNLFEEKISLSSEIKKQINALQIEGKTVMLL